MKRSIFVIGKWREDNKEVLDISYELGRKIAEHDWLLITGGGPGVMEYACKGAKSVGGVTIGFVAENNKNEVNEYVDIVIPTGMGYDIRSSLAVRTSDMAIVVGGGNGSLGEVSMMYLAGKPIFVISGSGGWADRFSEVLYEGKYLDEYKNVEIRYGNVEEIMRCCEQVAVDKILIGYGDNYNG